MAEVQTDYYEEMFKEITKKFYYGDDEDLESNHHMEDKTEGLLVDDDFKMIVVKKEDDDSSLLEEFNDEESPLLEDVTDIPNGFDTAADITTDSQLPTFTLDEENWICSDETISWTTSKIASYSATQKLFRCNECECIGFLSRIAEHWLGSHANLRVFQCSQCPYASAWARCVKMHLARQHHDICPETTTDEELQKLMKVNPVLEEVTKYLEKLKSKLESKEENTSESETNKELAKSETSTSVEISSGNRIATEIYTLASIKRYNCEHCSYATDRKDLFTRHENIHRPEKPFQCNVCQKQFNRADHIKKHFIRMHRDHEYHLNNVRRAKPHSKASSADSLSEKLQKDKTAGLRSVPPLTPIQKTQAEDTTITLQSIIQRAIPTTVVIATPTTHIIQNSHPTVIQSTQVQEFLQQNDPEPVDITAFLGTHTLLIPNETKQMESKPIRTKKSNVERSVQCSYCTWTGADNWCLKRHLNTHIKPYTCSMCGYKAARSERLTTHIFKVHNKRACTKCSFLADDIQELLIHQHENHKTTKSRKRSKPSHEVTLPENTSIISTQPVQVTSVIIQ